MKNFAPIKNARELTACAMFAALIAVGAFIKIPIGLVPVTFQVLFAAMAAFVLGPRVGTTAVVVYIMAGLAGAPIFIKGGGVWYIFEPTFGFLLGFAAAVLVSDAIAVRAKGKFSKYILASLAFIAVLYAVGLPYLYCIVKFYMGVSLPVGKLLTAYFLVFLPNDVLSCAVAAVAAFKIKPMLKIFK